jgi:hypothetical protein
MTDQFAMYDAAYLLGALTPADRSAYEAHLADCQSCSRAVSQQAGMPGLLAALTPEQARAVGEAGPEVPETLLPRLMAEVQRLRFRRRMSTVLVGVAAAAVIAAAVVFGIRGSSADDPIGPPPTVPAAQRMVPTSPDVPIRATARLSDADWGTRIVVRCVYKGGDEWPETLTYNMVVVDKSGHSEQIAGWEAVAGAPVVVDGTTSLPQSDIASVQVTTTQGKPILTLDL